MKEINKNNRKAEINIKLSEFEMPPMQDVLFVGRGAPIGPEAARRMVEVLSPNQYDIIKVDDPIIEAIVIRKSLLKMIPADKLIPIILEEGERVANECNIIKAQVDIVLHVSKSIEL